MKEKLLELNKKLEEQSGYSSKLKALKEKHKQEIEELKKECDVYSIETSINDLKNEAIVWALEEHQKTGEKKLLGGIGVQDKSTITYDKDKAFDWALEKKLCLNLDVKNFEKLAKTQKLDFVTLGKEKSVTFPKNISIK